MHTFSTHNQTTTRQEVLIHRRLEEGTYNPLIRTQPAKSIKPSRPNAQKIALAVAPLMRSVPSQRINALNEIARLAGTKPEGWEKPKFGDFEYWLAHNCKWISDAELQTDMDAHNTRRKRALQTSHRFSIERFTWDEEPRYKEPKDTGEYAPQVSMKLFKDRNLTDSARRIAMFIMRHAYQDNRKGRFIGTTVSFIMNGLELSRRTVQRSLTLLETRGYFFCEVAKSDRSRLCVGLIVHLLSPLFPKHHKKNWTENRRKSGASGVPQKHPRYKDFSSEVCKVARKKRISRLSWAIRCMDGVARIVFNTSSAFNHPKILELASKTT